MNWPDDAGVLYINIGHKHLNHLVVSLMSLRDIYQGPVALMVDAVCAPFVKSKIMPEERLHPIQLIEFDFERVAKRGSAYYAKTSMGDMSPFERTVFVDCDTVIVGNFADMLPPEGKDQVRLTQFADWTTGTRIIGKRIKEWQDILPTQYRTQVRHHVPAVNTGVMGFSKHCKQFMDRWKEMTRKNVSFICDEICAQLLYPEYPHMLLDERWNCSPKFSFTRHGPTAPKDDSRIWHGHGKKFLKNKPEVVATWWLPYYRRALESNIASICSWTEDERYKGMIRPGEYICQFLSKEYWEELKELMSVSA